MREFTEQELVRREKINNLVEKGIDPFGQRFDHDDFSIDIKEKYKDVNHDAFENMDDTATVAGRIMFIRKMGKASFFSIKDKKGSIQIYISINDVGEETYNLFKSADLGDIVGVHGKIMKTKERYRRRYVDLIMNDEAKKVAFMRPKIIRCIQNYMDNQGFTEVETPVLTTLLTGASARPFVTHHNTQDLDMYLRIALELPLGYLEMREWIQNIILNSL